MGVSLLFVMLLTPTEVAGAPQKSAPREQLVLVLIPGVLVAEDGAGKGAR